MGNSDSKRTPLFDDNEDEGESGYNQLRQDVQKACKCSLQTRITIFIIFSILGWALLALATIDFMIHGDSTHFVLLYSIGQVLNLSATCFLAGPIKQFKTMTDKKRWIASACYVGSMILAIVLAIVVPHLSGLVLLCLAVQIVSYFFYSLSFIPGGKKMLKKLCGCCVKSITES